MLHTRVFLVAPVALASVGSAQYSTEFPDDTGWTFVSTSGTSWAVDDMPGNMPGGPYRSAPFSLNVNLGGLVDTTYADSPTIDISSMTSPQLTFWCEWDHEGCCPDGACDAMELMVSNDGFASTLLSECVSDTCPVGLIEHQTWHEHTFALDPAWGTVQVRFFFNTYDVLFNFGKGWFIDDFSVADSCPGPQFYCPTSTNSTGMDARINFTGSNSYSANDLRLVATDTPPNQFTIFFMGASQTETPFADGFVCVSGQIWRYPVTTTGALGVPSQNIDFSLPPADLITVGSTWNFQNWFRDPQGPGGTGSNLTNALEVPFCP